MTIALMSETLSNFDFGMCRFSSLVQGEVGDSK